MAGDITLITGASSGIGEALARRLGRDRRPLALVARRTDRLERLAGELRAQHGVEVHVLTADLTQPGACARLQSDVEQRGLTVDWLINNAGFGTHGAFAELPVEREVEEVQLNVSALVELTGRFLPGMVQRRRGAVVNVASVGGFGPGPYMATYCATKAFVLSFTEALSYETRGSGLSVLTVSPGATRTEFFEVVGTADAAVGRYQTTEQVVSRALHELDRPSTPPSFVSGRLNAMMTKAAGFMPRRVTLSTAGRVLR